MTTTAKALATLNLLGAVISLALLATTFFSKAVIVREARQFALNKTQAYMDPAISKAEKLYANPLVEKSLSPLMKLKLKREIASYRESPEKWLLEIAEGTRDRARNLDFPEVRNPLARTALDYISKRVAQARGHFENSFSNLILDLRIFAITNSCAFLSAACLCLMARTKQARYWLCAWSAGLFVATLMAACFYSGQSWIWSILTNSYLGWSYVSFHCGITLYLFYKILPTLAKHAPADED